jgi:hypothetical protein
MFEKVPTPQTKRDGAVVLLSDKNETSVVCILSIYLD